MVWFRLDWSSLKVTGLKVLFFTIFKQYIMIIKLLLIPGSYFPIKIQFFSANSDFLSGKF